MSFRKLAKINVRFEMYWRNPVVIVYVCLVSISTKSNQMWIRFNFNTITHSNDFDFKLEFKSYSMKINA